MKVYTIDGITMNRAQLIELRDAIIEMRNLMVKNGDLPASFTLSMTIAFLALCISEVEA